MGWESFGVVGFDLGPLLQGQTRIGKLKSTYNWESSIYLFIWGFTSLSTLYSWKGRGNQYIQFVRVLYCKLPTNSRQLPAFPLEIPHENQTLASEVGGESVTTLTPWPL